MLMGLIDEQFMETPYYGARQMAWHLPAGNALEFKALRSMDQLFAKQ